MLGHDLRIDCFCFKNVFPGRPEIPDLDQEASQVLKPASQGTIGLVRETALQGETLLISPTGLLHSPGLNTGIGLIVEDRGDVIQGRIFLFLQNGKSLVENRDGFRVVTDGHLDVGKPVERVGNFWVRVSQMAFANSQPLESGCDGGLLFSCFIEEVPIAVQFPGQEKGVP